MLKNKFNLIYLLILSLALPINAMALVITNIDHLGNEIKLWIAPPQGDVNTPGSCYSFESDYNTQMRVDWFKHGLTFSTPTEKTANTKRICVISFKGFETFATNPLRDVPECHIEIYKIQGANSELRASPACGYKGRCPGVEDYNASDPKCLPCGEVGDNGAIGSGAGC